MALFDDLKNSPDLESILNDQFGRLCDKENEVHSKIRASKHTSKHITSYLAKRREIELKYMAEIANLSDNYISKINEYGWNKLLNNDKLQCAERKKYLLNLEKEENIFNLQYLEEKQSENELAKQIENNRKIILNLEKKNNKINKEIESIQYELKKMDEKRKMQERDRFNDKELKSFKNLRIKLHKLQSKQIERNKNYLQTKANHSNEMAKNMKIFLKKQINHSNIIKKGLFNLEQFQSELYVNCNQINSKKTSIINDINPVQQLLDWISLIASSPPPPSPNTKNRIHKNENANDNDRHCESVSSYSETTSTNTDNGSVQRAHSLDFIPLNKLNTSIKNKVANDLCGLINEYWLNAFPSYSYNRDEDDNNHNMTGQSLPILHESPNKNGLYCKMVKDDIDKLLLETAMDIKDFKSLYDTKSGYNIYCEFNQLFPCNLSYKILDTFYLKASEWNKIYFEFLLLGSNFFNNISPHVYHIWHRLIPNKLNLSKTQVNKLVSVMKPIAVKTQNDDLNYLTLNYYLWLISSKTRFQFECNKEYTSWLRRQLTVITAVIAWNIHNLYHSHTYWRLYDNQSMDYQQIISHLNNQCAKIVNTSFANNYNNELQNFIRNIDCLMGQISKYNNNNNKYHDSPLICKLNQSQSATQTEEEFESQSEIEYLSDEDEDDDDDEYNDNEPVDINNFAFKTPSKTHDNNDENSGYIGKYNIPFPSQVSRFILWQLLNALIIQKQDVCDKSKQSFHINKQRSLEIKTEEDEYYDVNNDDVDDEKLMIHSKVISVQSNTDNNKIDYDDLNIIPGTIEPHKTKKSCLIIADWSEYVDTFESAYCDLFGLNTYIIWVFMAKLCIDISLQHIDFDCDGISMLESLMTVPSQTSETTPVPIHDTYGFNVKRTSITDENVGDVGDDALNMSHQTSLKPKRSTKYHINKKWGKLKKKISSLTDENNSTVTNGEKINKFKVNKLVRRFSMTKLDKNKQTHSNGDTRPYIDKNLEISNGNTESMKNIFIKTWLSIYDSLKENNYSNISDLKDLDSVISDRIIRWILSNLQNWLFSYQSYPISISKDYFHLFISAQSIINSSIIDCVHCIENIFINATHIKYDAIYDSIIDIKYKSKSNNNKLENDNILNVNEWEMFVDALINWMDIESNNNESVFEQYHIHPRIGQFILFTLCSRFTNDFKHYIFHTDPFKLALRRQSVYTGNEETFICGDDKSMEQYQFITNFIDAKLIKLCGMARKFENNMILNKNLLFPSILNVNGTYNEIFLSPNYIALSQLNALVQSQSKKLLEWTKYLLLKEDWIGLDNKQPFSSSVIHLFNALNVFSDTLFKAIRKLEIRTLISSNYNVHVIKLRDSFIGIIRLCIDYYCSYICSISGNIKDIIPKSSNIKQLNMQNLQKSNNFNLKEIYRKSKKAVANKPKRSPSSLLILPKNDKKSPLSSFSLSPLKLPRIDISDDIKGENEIYFLYKQKAEILCTRFESLAKAVVLCKSLNHKIKTIWFETAANNANINNITVDYEWLNVSIENLCKTVDHFGNLIAFNNIFVDLRVDIIDNLYSSKPAINDNDNNSKKSAISKNGKIYENATSLNLWQKLENCFETIRINTCLDGFNCIVRKSFAIYLLSLRWILLHSNKNHKFNVNDHKVIQCDMIPMTKYFTKYLTNETIGEIRLLSRIDNVIDLMSKSSQTLVNCINSIKQFKPPFAASSTCKMRNDHSISPNDNDVLSIIDSANNPFLYHNSGHLFHSENYKDVMQVLPPCMLTKEKDLILYILVRRIEKNAQKFVAQQLNNTNIPNKCKKGNNNDNNNSDSDSFVSF